MTAALERRVRDQIRDWRILFPLLVRLMRRDAAALSVFAASIAFPVGLDLFLAGIGVTVNGMPLMTAYKIVREATKAESHLPTIIASPLFDTVSAAKEWRLSPSEFGKLDEWDRALMLAEQVVSGQIETVSTHGEKLEGVVISAAGNLDGSDRPG